MWLSPFPQAAKKNESDLSNKLSGGEKNPTVGKKKRKRKRKAKVLFYRMICSQLQNFCLDQDVIQFISFFIGSLRVTRYL